nr:mutant acetylcholine receptor DES-2-like [Haemonchus contortus]
MSLADHLISEESRMLWLVITLIVLFLLIGVSLISAAYEFIGFQYRKAKAKSQLRRFDELMTRVGRGTITGTPLAPDEQVLRAVCKCNKTPICRRNLYRVPSISPIAFECDASTGTENRLPATPHIMPPPSSSSTKSYDYETGAITFYR